MDRVLIGPSVAGSVPSQSRPDSARRGYRPRRTHQSCPAWIRRKSGRGAGSSRILTGQNACPGGGAWRGPSTTEPRPRLRRMSYCGRFRPSATLRLAASAASAGERGVNLHARSARPAPRPPHPHVRQPRQHLPDRLSRHRPAARMSALRWAWAAPPPTRQGVPRIGWRHRGRVARREFG